MWKEWKTEKENVHVISTAQDAVQRHKTKDKKGSLSIAPTKEQKEIQQKMARIGWRAI